MQSVQEVRLGAGEAVRLFGAAGTHLVALEGTLLLERVEYLGERPIFTAIELCGETAHCTAHAGWITLRSVRAAPARCLVLAPSCAPWLTLRIRGFWRRLARRRGMAT